MEADPQQVQKNQNKELDQKKSQQLEGKQQQKNIQSIQEKINQNSDQQGQKQEEQQEEQQSQGEQYTQKKSKWKKIQEPQKTVHLYMIDFGHCDVKKCSGKKLQRFKLLTSYDKKKKFKGIVLSAFGKKEVSNEDIQYAQKYGICVVDCSWNRIQETKDFRYKHQRKLPFVIAGNPVNYGKPYQLSCAEALATSLCTIGYIPQAQYIMSKFGWADGFWSLNKSIENYSKCKSLEHLRKQSKIIEETGNQTFQRNYDLSSPESDNE